MTVRTWLPAVLLVMAILATTEPANAAKRVALVIGNSAYKYTAELPNPQNDARLMSDVLKNLGFEVEVGIDLKMSEMNNKLRKFSSALEDAQIALFFYAGHGLQVDGENYLVPIDAELKEARHLDFESMSMRLVLDQLGHGNQRTSLIFLDACRNNPLARKLRQSIGQSRSINVGRGLARIESGGGTLIAYATAPDDVAADGLGKNSPFTAALAKWVQVPDLEVRQVMTRVRQSVYEETDRTQLPWDHSSLFGDFYFKRSERPDYDQALDREFWQAIKDSNDAGLFEVYLEKFPGGVFAQVARYRISNLNKPNDGPPPEQPAGPNIDEPDPNFPSVDTVPERQDVQQAVVDPEQQLEDGVASTGTSIDGLWRGEAVVKQWEGITYCKGEFDFKAKINGQRIEGEMRRGEQVFTVSGEIDTRGRFARVWGSSRRLNIRFSGGLSGGEISGAWSGDIASSPQYAGSCKGIFRLSRQSE